MPKQDTLRSLSIVPIHASQKEKYQTLALAPPVLNCDPVINLAEKQQYLTNQQYKGIITSFSMYFMREKKQFTQRMPKVAAVLKWNLPL